MNTPTEQYAYMCDLKRTLDAGGNCILEMPSGTGKTISLLSLTISYQMVNLLLQNAIHRLTFDLSFVKFYPERRKIVYCSRTMSEIEKALTELRSLMAFREKELGRKEPFRGLGLTSRKNLCLHPEVRRERKGAVVDEKCRSLTSSFVMEQKKAGKNPKLCEYHENLYELEPHNLIPEGVWTFDSLMQYCEETKQCPYFTVRRMVSFTR